MFRFLRRDVEDAAPYGEMATYSHRGMPVPRLGLPISVGADIIRPKACRIEDVRINGKRVFIA